MNILFYLAHPAHFYLFRNAIKCIKDDGNNVIVVAKSKDVLEQLLKEEGFEYISIEKKPRKANNIGVVFSLFRRNLKMYKLLKNYNIDTLVSSSVEYSALCRLLNTKSLTFFEDDFINFPFVTKVFKPFIDCMICPDSCNNGILENKTIHYPGNQEMAYLHPENFSPSWDIVKSVFVDKRKNFILRFAKLTAWHDTDIHGINNVFAEKIVNKLIPYGNVFITSERPLCESLEKYRIKIPASDIHHYLYFADLLISDSQTMTAEAAVLGTPSIRYNNWVGRLGYLNSLENDYGLSIGITPPNEKLLFEKIDEIIKSEDYIDIWKQKRINFIENSIKTDKMIAWFISRYPESFNIAKNNPSFLFEKFK